MLTQQVVQPHYVQGTLAIPPSKSYTQRAYIAALLKGGTTTLHNCGYSNDDNAILEVIQQLGATVHSIGKGTVCITSKFNTTKPSASEMLYLNIGESGLGLRMCTPIAALLAQQVHITGHGSITSRPMHFFTQVFKQLNISFQSNNGYVPFTITGPLVPAHITVDASASSQYLTGLLMAYSYAQVPATITVHNAVSTPYIDVTLSILEQFGMQVPSHKQYTQFVYGAGSVIPANNIEYTIEGDWSSASFMMVAAAINGNCTFTGLNVYSVQADRQIIKALELAQANLSIHNQAIQVSKSALQAFTFDATQCPDLFPPLVALAAHAYGTSCIQGVHRLQHKESDRAATLQQEFAKLGIHITIDNDYMYITGVSNMMLPQGVVCTSHNDHRIAMSLAVAVGSASHSITILQAQAVAKSYPNFFEDLQELKK